MTTQPDDDFFTELGMSNATDEQKEKISQDMVKTIEQRVLIRIAESLTDEQLEEFERMSTEQGDSEESDKAVVQWLQDKDIDYEFIMGEELARLRQELRSNVDAIMNDVAA